MIESKNILIKTDGSPGTSANYGKHNSLTKLNDSTFVVAYQGWDYDGYIATLKIDVTGKITVLEQFEFDKTNANYNSLITVDDNTVALSYSNGSIGQIKTFTIATDGSSIAEVNKKTIPKSGKNYFSFVKVSESIYALAFQGEGADGFISTVQISLDGSTIDFKDTYKHDPVQNDYNSLIKIAPNTLMLAYSGLGQDGYIKTFTHANDGTNITQVISLEHNQQKGMYNDLTQIDSDTYLLTYAQENNHFYYRTFTSNWLESEVAPEISKVKLKNDNSEVYVTFNEPVYTAKGGTTALVKEDFKLSLSGGTAKLGSTTPTSFSKNSNTYTLGISLTGTPDGLERLTVSPAAADAIYDANDNAAGLENLRNSVNLFDKTLPSILSVVDFQNEYIDITFSEPVFGGKNGYTKLDVNDFTLSIAGGTATLTNNRPTEVIGYGGPRQDDDF